MYSGKQIISNEAGLAENIYWNKLCKEWESTSIELEEESQSEAGNFLFQSLTSLDSLPSDSPSSLRQFFRKLNCLTTCRHGKKKRLCPKESAAICPETENASPTKSEVGEEDDRQEEKVLVIREYIDIVYKSMEHLNLVEKEDTCAVEHESDEVALDENGEPEVVPFSQVEVSHKPVVVELYNKCGTNLVNFDETCDNCEEDYEEFLENARNFVESCFDQDIEICSCSDVISGARTPKSGTQTPKSVKWLDSPAPRKNESTEKQGAPKSVLKNPVMDRTVFLMDSPRTENRDTSQYCYPSPCTSNSISPASSVEAKLDDLKDDKCSYREEGLEETRGCEAAYYTYPRSDDEYRRRPVTEHEIMFLKTQFFWQKLCESVPPPPKPHQYKCDTKKVVEEAQPDSVARDCGASSSSYSVEDADDVLEKDEAEHQQVLYNTSTEDAVKENTDSADYQDVSDDTSCSDIPQDLAEVRNCLDLPNPVCGNDRYVQSVRMLENLAWELESGAERSFPVDRMVEEPSASGSVDSIALTNEPQRMKAHQFSTSTNNLVLEEVEAIKVKSQMFVSHLKDVMKKKTDKSVELPETVPENPPPPKSDFANVCRRWRSEIIAAHYGLPMPTRSDTSLSTDSGSSNGKQDSAISSGTDQYAYTRLNNNKVENKCSSWPLDFPRYPKKKQTWTNSEPPENDLQKNSADKVLSEHQLRVQRSLQKLNIPDWYKNSATPREGFLLKKRGSDAGSNYGWAAHLSSGLNEKTTSLGSLGGQSVGTNSLSAHGQGTTRSPLSLAPQSSYSFTRWSTSRLNSAQTSPCSSARSSVRSGPSTPPSPLGGTRPSLRPVRQPYLGWRSQERLTTPRTPHERLAVSLLPQSPPVQSNAEIQSSIKEVTNAIVHYVSTSNEPTSNSQELAGGNSNRQGSPRLWLESSFVGTKPLESPQTPVVVQPTPVSVSVSQTVSSLGQSQAQSSRPLQLDLPLSNGGGTIASTTYQHDWLSPQKTQLLNLAVSRPSPNSTTLEDVLDSLLGLPSSAPRVPSPQTSPRSPYMLLGLQSRNQERSGSQCSSLHLSISSRTDTEYHTASRISGYESHDSSDTLHHSTHQDSFRPLKSDSPDHSIIQTSKNHNLYRPLSPERTYLTFKPQTPDKYNNTYKSLSPEKTRSTFRPSSPEKTRSPFKPSSPEKYSQSFNSTQSPERTFNSFRSFSPDKAYETSRCRTPDRSFHTITKQSESPEISYHPFIAAQDRSHSSFRPHSPEKSHYSFRTQSPEKSYSTFKPLSPERSFSTFRPQSPERTVSTFKPSTPDRSNNTFRQQSPERVHNNIRAYSPDKVHQSSRPHSRTGPQRLIDEENFGSSSPTRRRSSASSCSSTIGPGMDGVDNEDVSSLTSITRSRSRAKSTTPKVGASRRQSEPATAPKSVSLDRRTSYDPNMAENTKLSKTSLSELQQSKTSLRSIASINTDASEEVLVHCRYTKCTSATTQSEAKRHFKNCHNCSYLYCSRECRRAHWEKHRKVCLHSRASTLCKQILSTAKECADSWHHISLIAQKGYLTHGRGVVKAFFTSPEAAEKFLSNGFQSLGEPIFVKWPDLMPNEMGPELYAELVKLCKSYNPETKLVLYVAVCVISEVPTKGAVVKWERQLVSRCAKMRLSKTVSGLIPHGQVPFHLSPKAKVKNKSNSQERERRSEVMETLILTSNSANIHNKGSMSAQKLREISFNNIQTQLSQRGVNLKKHYPEVHSKLCAYVEGSCDKFAPMTVYPRNNLTGKYFMCVIMPETEPDKFNTLPSDGVQCRTVDVSLVTQTTSDEMKDQVSTPM